MALLTYLTTTHFDHGAIKMLAPELKRLGVSRPLFVTDRGVRAAGLLLLSLVIKLHWMTNFMIFFILLWNN